jgi:hypothetical protein
MSFEEAIETYKSIGHRNPYLFQWLYNVYKKLRLPCADKKYIDDLALTKTKLTIFDVLIDDVADNINFRNKEMLDRLTLIPWQNSDYTHNDPYYKTCKKIWIDCLNSIEKYPRFHEFEGIFYFDLKQVMNAMEYSWLINFYPEADDSVSNDAYGHHGTMVILHGMIDLMCSPKFDINELGKIRAVLYRAQRIARTGNMLNTYPREFIERDLSSPIITYALEKNIITLDEFRHGDPKELEAKIKLLEAKYKREVEDDFKGIMEFKGHIKSFDVCEFTKAARLAYEAFIARIRYWEVKD